MNTTMNSVTRDEAVESEPAPEVAAEWAHEEYLSVWLRRQAQSYANLGTDRGRLVADTLEALALDALACETPGRVLDVPTFLARRVCLESERDWQGWPDAPDDECDGYRWTPTRSL